MARLYYTCPIEAAYMAKNFGVKIMVNDTEGTEMLCVISSLSRDKYYIHPDSLSVFEPQEGDLVYCMGSYQIMPADIDDFGVKYDRRIIIQNVTSPIATGKIIQRNNKPFIMPQSEEN